MKAAARMRVGTARGRQDVCSTFGNRVRPALSGARPMRPQPTGRTGWGCAGLGRARPGSPRWPLRSACVSLDNLAAAPFLLPVPLPRSGHVYRLRACRATPGELPATLVSRGQPRRYSAALVRRAHRRRARQCRGSLAEDAPSPLPGRAVADRRRCQGRSPLRRNDGEIVAVLLFVHARPSRDFRPFPQ